MTVESQNSYKYIDTDGETKILYDGTNIFQLCNAAKLIASAIICIRDGE